MNYNAPLQHTNGTWAYCRNGRPVGYCQPFVEASGDVIDRVYMGREHYEKEASPQREALAAGKYHEGGHATEEEACECYKQYLLDFDLQFHDDNEKATQLNKCKHPECSAFTSGYASAGWHRQWTLCAEHRTREVVSALLEVHESWDS